MGVKPHKKRPLRLPAMLAGLVVLLWVLHFVRWQPGEVTLLRRFHKNRAAFEELKAIVSTNQPVTAEQAVYQGANTWSVSDYRRYCKLLKQAGVIRVTQKEHEFRFVLVESRSGKKRMFTALAWRDLTPEVLLERLKDVPRTGGQPAQAYRRLEDNWYLWTQQ